MEKSMSEQRYKRLWYIVGRTSRLVRPAHSEG